MTTFLYGQDELRMKNAFFFLFSPTDALNVFWWYITEGDMGICAVAVLTIFHCGDAVNEISSCGVAVIPNPTVCDVCVFHVAVFGKMKLFAVMGCFDLPLSNLHLA